MPTMKPLVALYKTYRGGEWFGPSLESVRRGCAGIVAVMSDRPWKRSELLSSAFPTENCSSPLARFRERYPGDPVSIVRPGMQQDTEEQYRVGLAVIKALYGPCCGVLIVDTDEVWEESALRLLREEMSSSPKALYFRSRIWSYLRSPLYRVTPQEPSRPVIGLANPDVPTGKSRFANLHALTTADRIRDVGCTMHHFGYVRLDPEEILTKLANTASQDGVKPRPNWKQTVWDLLPRGRDLHPARGFESCWGGVEEVAPVALPASVTQSATFWETLSYHRGGVPLGLLMNEDAAWREATEKDEAGISTTTTAALCLSAALESSRGRLTQEDCTFLTPRLRMSFRETIQLAEHSRQVPAGGLVLEIGSGLGGSLSIVGSCAPSSARLVAVDPFQLYEEENVVMSHGVSVSTPEELNETITRTRVNATILRKTSADARAGWEEGAIDLLLVDGNHSYQHALHDLKAWWPLLRPGGTLLLHDLSGRFPGVVRAARVFEEATGLKFSLPSYSSLAWLRKP